MADTVASISPWERALMAGERVKLRMRRAAGALDAAGLAYAVVGGNAVAEWVARVDEGAVRFTRDVDLLVRRDDFEGVRRALEAAGFVYHRLLDVDVFLDGPNAKPSESVRILYAGEIVRPGDALAAPTLDESERAADFQVVSLEALVRMKLLAWRRKDQTHLDDLLQVGLIDATWPARFPPDLAARLQSLIDDPNG